MGWNEQKFQKAKRIISPILNTAAGVGAVAAGMGIKKKLADLNMKKQQRQLQAAPKSRNAGGSRNAYELPDSVVNLHKRPRSNEDV